MELVARGLQRREHRGALVVDSHPRVQYRHRSARVVLGLEGTAKVVERVRVGEAGFAARFFAMGGRHRARAERRAQVGGRGRIAAFGE